MTEGYINQRLPRNNPIAYNQNHVKKILTNPMTPKSTETSEKATEAFID